MHRGKRRAASVEAILREKSREIRRHEQGKERLLDLYQGGFVQMNEIETRLATIRHKIKEAEDEERMLRQEMERNSGQMRLIEQFSTFRSKVIDRLDCLTFAERKTLVRLLVKEVIVDTNADELTIKHVIPGDEAERLCLGRNATESQRGPSPLAPARTRQRWLD